MNTKKTGIILIFLSITWLLFGWIIVQNFIGPLILRYVDFYDSYMLVDLTYFDRIEGFQNGSNLCSLLIGILGVSFLKK